ncbi:uncharacterized protein [Anoplolepis gracilipes]|uniref:uncharacterized protein n=1 Tax=Anoplolepis gracilipes TaxID=354296 RepID=UPI003BA068EA
MTDNQLYVPFRNEQTLLTNSCEYTSRNALFDLEIYGPYLDKIRELFVPSLEYRIHSMLEEFVYSENSRWAMQFPYFKKIVDTIATWRDPLIRAAEYDIGTMEKAIRNTVKRVVKDDLVTSFLESIILHYRLNKICRELDALGIEDNILRSLNIWNFVNEKKYYRADRDYFTNTDNANSSNVTMSSRDVKGSARCKKAIELATHDAYVTFLREKNTEQPTTSEYRLTTYRQIDDANQDFHQRHTEDDSTRNTKSISQNDDKMVESVNEEPPEFAKTQKFGKRLKMIIRKMYPENCSHPTLSISVITYLALPCKPSDLIERIFEADPSLTESCFIVMKRKFLISVYNVCSCLNDILGKLDVKFTKMLYLNCEIYPGYICFRLKNDNINKCLFVTRISICQNVCRRTIQRNSAISTCKSKLNTNEKESKCAERCNDDDNDILDEKSEELDDTCCLRSDRNVKDTVTNMSRDETGNGNKEVIICTIKECGPKCFQDFTTCNKSCENIAEKTCDVTLHVDNSEERIRKYHEISHSIEIDCENVAEKCRGKVFDSDNLIAISSKKLVKTNHEMKNIFSNKDLEGFSQPHDRPYLLDKESNLEDEDCNANTCSITSFVQNSERDKQLVELNCNRFLDNDIRAIDERSGDDGSLNSAKAEIGCDSNCSSNCNEDFINITVIDNILDIARIFEANQDVLDVTKIRNSNYCKSSKISSENNADSLAVSVQTPRLRVSSKGISVNVSYPGVGWLASGDDGSTSMKIRDRRVEVMNPSSLIFPRKGNKIIRNKRVFDETRSFIKPSRRSSVPRSRLRSNGDLESSDISNKEYLHSTSNTSRCCCSTCKFIAGDRRDKFEKFPKSTKLSGLCLSSSNGFRSVTSFTTIKYGTASRKDNDYSAKVPPQAILVMTKFRNSIDRSIGKIKRLIHKLRKILFNDETKTTNASRTFWKNEKFSEDTTRKRTSGRCIRQDYSITSCSTCNCCRQGCTLSSCESSNVTLSIRRNRCREGSKGGIKFRDRRLTGGSEILSAFRSIETSYDLWTPTVDDLEEHKLGRSDRCNKRKKIGRNGNYRTSTTISSQPKISANDSKYLERYTCKQREKTRDDKRDYEGIDSQDRWKETRYGCKRRERTRREIPIKCSISNESLGVSSSSNTQRGNIIKVHKQSRSGSEGSRAKNTREFVSSGKNRQKNAHHFDDRLKKRVFGIMTDICNDYADDLDLDFKLHLLRYVELCRSVKRALIKTLRLDDDFYENDTMSSARWRSTEEYD